MRTEFLNSLGRGATFKEISKKIVEEIEIQSPKIELQKEFAERVKAIEAQKALAEQELEKADELFNSLLQKAFKGN